MLACCHAGSCFHLGPWQQLLAPFSPPTHPPITPRIPVPTFMDVRGQTWISAKTMELVNDGRIISPSRSNDDGSPRVSRRGPAEQEHKHKYHKYIRLCIDALILPILTPKNRNSSAPKCRRIRHRGSLPPPRSASIHGANRHEILQLSSCRQFLIFLISATFLVNGVTCGWLKAGIIHNWGSLVNGSIGHWGHLGYPANFRTFGFSVPLPLGCADMQIGNASVINTLS